MRVLQLSTHSTLIPRHGGKLRSHHIGRVLEQQGFDIHRIAFCHRVHDDIEDPREPIIDVSRMPYWRSKEFADLGPCRTYLFDYFSTIGALEVPDLLAEFDEHVRAVAPHVVMLEHPWTWPLLSRLEEVRSGAIRIIYNSQNVEIALKQRIMTDQGITPPTGTLEGVEALERDLVAHAEAVTACTRADAYTFASWGARRVLMVANGGVRVKRDHLLDILPLPLQPWHSYVLTIGSNHPPNISGFMNLVAPSLSLLRPHQRVVVAGGAAPFILQALEAKGLARMAAARLVSLGSVDEFCLDCVIANAHALFLPIQFGGGSNVKTAEALLSGRPTVATSIAMRGFDEFRNTPGVTLANNAVDFGTALLAILDAPYQGSRADYPALSALLWEATIAPLVELLREIETKIKAGQLRTLSSPGAVQ